MFSSKNLSFIPIGNSILTPKLLIIGSIMINALKCIIKVKYLCWQNLIHSMNSVTMENPDAQDTLKLINQGLKKRALIILVACSRIFYEGRARSKLEWGDRNIMIKQDGSFLIHQYQSGASELAAPQIQIQARHQR